MKSLIKERTVVLLISTNKAQNNNVLLNNTKSKGDFMKRTIMINNKAVEIEGVNFSSMSTDAMNGGNAGVSAFIRTTIQEAAKQGAAVKIADLAKLLITTFGVTDEQKAEAKKKGLPEPKGLPSDQARQRINNVLRNSKKDEFVKVTADDGMVALTTGEALKKVKDERAQKAADGKKAAEAREFGIGK